MKEFYNINEMKEHYDMKTNKFYIEDDIRLNFNLDCTWDIICHNLTAKNITAGNIDCEDLNAFDVNVYDIHANDINVLNIKAYNIHGNNVKYWASCVSYKNITCRSIKGYRQNARHITLDGDIYALEKGEYQCETQTKSSY